MILGGEPLRKHVKPLKLLQKCHRDGKNRPCIFISIFSVKKLWLFRRKTWICALSFCIRCYLSGWRLKPLLWRLNMACRWLYAVRVQSRENSLLKETTAGTFFEIWIQRCSKVHRNRQLQPKRVQCGGIYEKEAQSVLRWVHEGNYGYSNEIYLVYTCQVYKCIPSISRARQESLVLSYNVRKN